MVIDCADKIALVVGGSRGIGRQTCLALAAAGATVVPTGRSLAAASAVSKEITDRGGDALPLALDVVRPDDCEKAAEFVARHFGRIDVLVANAGINPYYVRAEEVTTAVWDEIMDVNLRGVFFAVQAAAKRMLAAGVGSIISVSSVTAVVGTLRGMPYTASKGGLDAMTRTLAVEWADRGVRVNAVAPGYVDTELTKGVQMHDGIYGGLLAKIPLGRFGASEEIASLITFLASDAASYVTGQVLYVDGGMQSA